MRSKLIFVVSAGLLWAIVCLPRQTMGDDGVAEALPAAPSASKSAAQTSQLSPDQIDQIEQWIDQLGSSRFLTRERAYERLSEFGHQVVPFLLERYESTGDTEVRARAKSLADQLSVSYWLDRIDRFLEGQDVGFPGWESFHRVMGDGQASRQVFIKIMRDHPTLSVALDGPAAKLESVASLVSSVALQKLQFGNLAASDVIAVFLPLANPDLPVSIYHENVMIRLLQSDASREVNAKPGLREPFVKLLGKWVQRSSQTRRSTAFFLAMQWGVESALPVAIETIQETTDFDLLSTAMRVIACFGSPSDAEHLRPLLDNQQMAKRAAFAGRLTIKTKICDLAIATIAIVHGERLSNFGFPDDARHFRSGFNDQVIGFADAHQADRTKYIEKAKQLLDSHSSAKGP